MGAVWLVQTCGIEKTGCKRVKLQLEISIHYTMAMTRGCRSKGNTKKC